MALNNPWIKYIDRSYEQIKNAILSQFPAKTPELTDHTENNIFVRLVSVWAGITEMLSYYIDVVAREFYLTTARYYPSAVKLSQLFNYRIRGVRASTTDIKFTISSTALNDISIPKYTHVQDASGLSFITTVDGVLPAGDNAVNIPAKQGVYTQAKNVGTSSGLESQQFELGADVEDGTVELVIDGVTWTFVNNLAFSSADDLHFTTSINQDKKMYLLFGDDTNGKIPNNGSDIIINYVTSKGLLGNISIGTITDLRSTIATPNGETFSVSNSIAATGGQNIESLVELKKNIPLSIRTLERGVTLQDVQDLVLLYGGIDSVVLNKTQTGIDIYVSPIGGGNTTQTFKDELLTYLTSKMQQLVLIRYAIKDVFTIYPILEIDVKVKDNYTYADNETEIKNTIIENISNIDINKPLVVGNVYEVFENLDAIEYSDNLQLSYKIPIVGEKDLTFTSFKIKAVNNPINNLYKIKVNASNLTLFKNDTSLLDFTYGQSVSVEDFDMILNNNNYVTDDEWEFYIYNINKSIYPSTISNYKLLLGNLKINEL